MRTETTTPVDDKVGPVNEPDELDETGTDVQVVEYDHLNNDDERNPWKHSMVGFEVTTTGLVMDILVWNERTGATFRCGSVEDANTTIRDNYSD